MTVLPIFIFAMLKKKEKKKNVGTQTSFPFKRRVMNRRNFVSIFKLF